MQRTALAASLAICLALGALATEVLVTDGRLIGEAEARAVAKSKASPDLAPQHLYLIRSSLSALQDANRTGNYSVLRDLCAPSFQARHSAADLAEHFAPARRKPIDLAAAAIETPMMTEVKRSDPAQLSLSGQFPSGAEHVAFTLIFEAVHGHWRLAWISLASIPASPASSQGRPIRP